MAAAGQALGDIWCWNVFPKMNIKWGTYVNHIGHPRHEHRGRLLPLPRRGAQGGGGEDHLPGLHTCHSVLAQEEKDPEILKTILSN